MDITPNPIPDHILQQIDQIDVITDILATTGDVQDLVAIIVSSAKAIGMALEEFVDQGDGRGVGFTPEAFTDIATAVRCILKAMTVMRPARVVGDIIDAVGLPIVPIGPVGGIDIPDTLPPDFA